jgi:hypothetical protein
MVVLAAGVWLLLLLLLLPNCNRPRLARVLLVLPCCKGVLAAAPHSLSDYRLYKVVQGVVHVQMWLSCQVLHECWPQPVGVANDKAKSAASAEVWQLVLFRASLRIEQLNWKSVDNVESLTC